MSGVQISWEDDFEKLFKDSVERDRYFSGWPDPTLYTTWDWFDCARKHLVDPGRTLRLLVARNGPDLLAVLPFTLGLEKINGIPVTTLRLLGYPLTDQFTLPSQETEVISAMMETLANGKDWDLAVLSELPEGSSGHALMEKWKTQTRALSFSRHCAHAPVLPLQGHTEASLNESFSRSLRTRLSRAGKKIKAAGQVNIERKLPGPEQVPALLDQIKAIEDLSWKGESGVGIFSTDQRFVFFSALSTRLAEKGMLEIWLLTLDEQLISYRYGFRFQGRFLDYNLAFHPEFNHLSPGRFLLGEIITGSLQDGLAFVDASRGSLTRKHQLGDWIKSGRDHYEWMIFTPSWRGALLHLLTTRVKPLARRVRQWWKERNSQEQKN